MSSGTLRARLAETVAELDARRLQRRFEGVAVSNIATAPERVPIRFGGEVRTQQREVARGRPILRVTVSDGTGTAVAVFTGRTRIRGLEAGSAALFEGVGRWDRERLVVVNPAYTLLR